MSTKIIGNQISDATRAIITALTVTEQINLPNLNQTEINALGTVALGTIVYNETEKMIQGYLPDVNGPGSPGWDDVGGGGPSVGEDSIIRTNGTTINENLTVGPSANNGVEFSNGFSAAPITIANGNTVTIENGATWTLIGVDEDLSSYRYFNYAAVNNHLRMVGGSTFEFGQTKERMISFALSSTVALDHSAAQIFETQNPTTFTNNFTLNFQNVPNVAGFMYVAQVLIRQATATSGNLSSVQINGQTATLNGGFSPGSGYDLLNFFFYLDGATWRVFLNPQGFEDN